MMERLKDFYFPEIQSPSEKHFPAKRALHKTRLLATLAFGSALTAYFYRVPLKERISLFLKEPTFSLPPSSGPLPTSLPLKEIYPDIEPFLKEVQKQLQATTKTSISRSYQLTESSGHVVQLTVKTRPQSSLKVLGAVNDPLPQYEQLFSALEKINSSKDICLDVTVVPTRAPCAPPPVDLTVAIEPNLPALSTAIESQLKFQSEQQTYRIDQKDRPILFTIYLKKEHSPFPYNHNYILIDSKFRSDPLYPLFRDALKTFIYHHTGSYPAFLYMC